MTTLHMGSHTWVLLNSNRVASDIIAKRAKVTNERPYMPIAGGLVSNNKRAVIRQAAEWGEGRRVMHHLLSGSALKLYGEWQELESVQLLLSYLKEPEKWYAHHFRYSTAIFYRIVMGERLFKTQEQLDNYQQVTMEFLFSLFRSPIDFFPILDKLPTTLQFWRKPWAEMGRFHRRIFQEWWNPIRAAVDNGTAAASFVRDVLLHPDVKFVGDDEEAMYLATSVMAAGGDNTRMTLNTFVMSTLCYPMAYEQARAEIENICGVGDTARLPGMQDMASMPFVCAVVKEILRWRPTVPLIPPHQLTEEIEYEGYNFPVGTNFLINTIAVCSECEAPDEFRPERWLDGNETNVVHDFWGFGGGRRICVGYKVVQQALFVAIARLIYCYEITPVSCGIWHPILHMLFKSNLG